MSRQLFVRIQALENALEQERDERKAETETLRNDLADLADTLLRSGRTSRQRAPIEIPDFPDVLVEMGMEAPDDGQPVPD